MLSAFLQKWGDLRWWFTNGKVFLSGWEGRGRVCHQPGYPIHIFPSNLLKILENLTICNSCTLNIFKRPGVKCHILCHMSHFMFHMSFVTCHVFSSSFLFCLFFGWTVGAVIKRGSVINLSSFLPTNVKQKWIKNIYIYPNFTFCIHFYTVHKVAFFWILVKNIRISIPYASFFPL